MTKQLYEILKKLKQCILFNLDIKLTYKEVCLLMKYIDELEKEVAGDINE